MIDERMLILVSLLRTTADFVEVYGFVPDLEALVTATRKSQWEPAFDGQPGAPASEQIPAHDPMVSALEVWFRANPGIEVSIAELTGKISKAMGQPISDSRIRALMPAVRLDGLTSRVTTKDSRQKRLFTYTPPTPITTLPTVPAPATPAQVVPAATVKK